MEIHLLETVTSSRGVVLEDLPFNEGEEVEITIKTSKKKILGASDAYPLRGTAPYSYEDPFSPMISWDDWKSFE